MHTNVKQELSGLALTNEEVLALLEDRTHDTLLSVTHKIAMQYAGSSKKKADAQAAEQVFRLVVRETEMQLRSNLSQQVKVSRFLPRDIAMSLASDVEQVAIPMLESSEALAESDLLELISATSDDTRFLAITRRDYVSAQVSDSLIQKGNEEVAVNLVQNIGAEISETGMSHIVERFPENKPLMSALVSRPMLPAAIAEKLISHVSDSLGKTLKEKHNLSEKDIEQEVEKTREGETLKLIRVTRDPQEIDQLVTQLITFKRLTPSIILSGLAHGNVIFFETVLARLANIPMNNARALISDRGDLGFRAIYNKSNLPDKLFPAVRLLLQAVRTLNAEAETPGTTRYANRVVDRLLAYAQSTPVENLSYMIALVRRAA